ncbi:MAG: 16S rRNA (cytosine(1402)-N(4))-methyltransferase RsmH [Desulfovibrionaceae bacterium]
MEHNGDTTYAADPHTGHVSVLLREVLDQLQPRPGGRYLDGTVGFGGHSLGMLERADGQAELLCLDKDARALDMARARLAPHAARVRFAHCDFSAFDDALDGIGWEGEALDGALVDLGVSSMHLDDASRGFSFLTDGPLDMRMDPSSGAAPAAQLVNKAGFEELKRIITEYGEDPMAGRIARAIVDARAQGPVERTVQLAEIVSKAYPAKMRHTARNHPATRTFQALRMAVNDELGVLRSFLERITGRVRPGGRIAVISFHSLEDRIVKHHFRDEARTCICPREALRCACNHKPALKVVTKRPITPSEDEIRNNSRSRSAKLRVAERLYQGA